VERDLKIIGLLLGRAGSRGYPGKNVAPVLGRPCLHYPLMAARSSDLIDNIYLSTDSDDIKREAATFGTISIDRPAELATDEALLEDAIYHAFQEIDQRENGDFDAILVILCNAPTVLPDRLRKAASILYSETDLDSVTTGAKLNMYTPVRARRRDEETGRLSNYIPLETLNDIVTISCDRDASEDCYFCDHSFTLVRRSALATMPTNNGPFRWMGNNIHLMEQPAGACDIDYGWQVGAVEYWLQQHSVTELEVPFWKK